MTLWGVLILDIQTSLSIENCYHLLLTEQTMMANHFQFLHQIYHTAILMRKLFQEKLVFLKKGDISFLSGTNKNYCE